MAALIPTAAFAESGAAEPLADGTVSVGSPSSDDARLSEDIAEDAEPLADENILDDPLPLGGARLSEDAAADEALANTDGAEVSEEGPDTGNLPFPTDSADPSVPDNGISLMSIGTEDESIMKDYFKQFPGEYTLPDGSEWKVIVSPEGELTMSSPDGKANEAYVDSITKSGADVTKVTFASNNWHNNKGVAPQKLTLTWTTAVNSSYAHKSFKCAAATLYNDDGKTVTIEIGDDGVPVLHAQDGKDLTPLYYNVNNAEWLADEPENSQVPPKVTSVAYSAEDWYAQDKAPNTVDRTRLLY